jgi:tetratricopeptide (TPR) repeat protein
MNFLHWTVERWIIGAVALSGTMLTACKSSSNTKPDALSPALKSGPQAVRLQLNAHQEIDWEQAIERLSKPPLSDPEADLAYLMAEQFINMKQIEPATRLMRAVFKSHPTLVSGIELVRLATLSGELVEADQVTKKLRLFYPNSPEPALAQSYIAQLKGNRKEAIDILAQAHKRHPTDEDIANRYISVLIEAGQKAKAKEILLGAIVAMPQSPHFLLRLARIKSDEKQFKEAKNLLDKLLKIAPEDIEAWTLAGFIASEEENYAAAEKYFREAYDKQPENDTLARYYVTQLLRLNKFQEARRLLIRLESTTNDGEQFDSDLTFQLGYVLFQLEDFQEAKKRFLMLVDKADDKDRMHFYAAQCEERLKNPEAALALYNLVQGETDVAKVARQRIIVLTTEAGKYEDISSLLADYKTRFAKSLDADDFRFIASSFAKIGDFSAAQTSVDAGLKLFSKSPDLLYLKAAYLEHTESRVASIEALEKLILRFPNHVQSLNHLGYTLSEANEKLDFALSLVQRALKSEPRNGFYLDSLGWIYFKLKMYAEAEKYLSLALKFEPNEPVVFEHMAELKYAQGDFGAALKLFERAENIFKTVPEWRIQSDTEWSLSRKRVQSRIQELREKALPKGQG